MAGLKQTTAKLAGYRRNFEKLLAANGASQSPSDRAPSGPGHLTETVDFGSNPGNLRMFTYVPETCTQGAPLVVVLHGCTQTADGYQHGAGWSTLAERFGFALLAPEQQRSNNPNNCFNWFLPGDTSRSSGEALSIRQMIDRVISDARVDRRRVFVTGLSAGGAMTAVMLATYPEIFAGGAIVAGLPYGAASSVQEAFDSMFQGKNLAPEAWGDLVRGASRHKGPWPKISIWHGSADPTVVPLNAEELAKQWTHVHGLSPQPDVRDTVEGYPHRAWLSAEGEPLVESYTITGMAHGTPICSGDEDQACGTAAPFILETGISSSYRIAAFWGLVGQGAERAPRGMDAAHRRNGARAEAGLPTPPDGFRPEAPRPRWTAASSPQRPAHQGSGFDPQIIINKALRKAGLLKG